jgi:hypothetical protein
MLASLPLLLPFTGALTDRRRSGVAWSASSHGAAQLPLRDGGGSGAAP